MTTLLDVGSDTAAMAERVCDAIEARTPLRIVGAGTWLDAAPGGRDRDSGVPLSMREHAGIVDYVPGDFTLTARAGTSLAEISAATARENQWLTLDPMGSSEGTIGATVSTASWGPLATGYGTPRDIVLGLEAITGRGAVIRGGGRVVKNVAGFDLTRLFTGAWGTLGVITEVSVRLRALPECDETIAVTIGDSASDVEHLVTTLQRWPFTPVAMELLDRGLARRAVGASSAVALIRITGNERDVRAQADAIDRIGLRVPVVGDVWMRLRTAEPAAACVFRLSGTPSALAARWDDVKRLAAATDGAMFSATPARGVVRAIFPRLPSGFEGLARTRSHVERSPEPWPAAVVDAGILELERRLIDAFNPHRILNPGISVRPS
jgi:FAD/FMN-containing dehydrogenase